MGSDSDLESLSFSDVEEEVMGDEDSEDEGVEESDDDKSDDVEKVPDQPKATSMAARIVAARSAKASNGESRLRKAMEDAAAAKEREKERKAQEERRRKAFAMDVEQGKPDHPKAHDPAAKKAHSPSQKKPVAPQKEPTVIEVEDSSEESDESSSSDSSSEEEDEKTDAVEPPPAPAESPRKRKGVPKKRVSASAKALATQKDIQSNDESDDIPLTSLAVGRRGAAPPHQRPNLPAKPTSEKAKNAGEKPNRQELETRQNATPNGEARVKRLKKPRAPTGSRKLAGQDDDELERTQSAAKPKILRKRAGPGSRSVIATGEAAHDQQGKKSVAKQKDVTEQEKSETPNRKATEGRKLQREEDGEKKGTGTKRARKADELRKKTEGDERSKKNEEEQRQGEGGKQPGKTVQHQHQKTKDKDNERQRKEEEAQRKREDAEAQRKKDEELRKKKAEDQRKKKADEQQKRKAEEQRKKQEDDSQQKNAEKQRKKAEDERHDVVDAKCKQQDHEGNIRKEETDTKTTEPEKRKRKQLQKQEGPNMLQLKRKTGGERKKIFHEPETEDVDHATVRDQDAPMIAIEDGARSADSQRIRSVPTDGRDFRPTTKEINSAVEQQQIQSTQQAASPRRSLRKRKQTEELERSATGQFRARKALKVDSLLGLVANDAIDSSKAEPNAHILAADVEEDQEFTFTAAVRAGNGPGVAVPFTDGGHHGEMEVSESGDERDTSGASIDLEGVTGGDSRGEDGTTKPSVDERRIESQVLVSAQTQGVHPDTRQRPQPRLNLDSRHDPERVKDENLTEAKDESLSHMLAPGLEHAHSQVLMREHAPLENQAQVHNREVQLSQATPQDQVQLRDQGASDRQAQSHDYLIPDGLPLGSTPVLGDGTQGVEMTARGPLFGPFSGEPSSKRLSEHLPQTPLPLMTDQDEPLQAMMLCQELERSFWDFAEAQDNMINGFLNLVRRRSSLVRSRSANDYQAWASAEERRYLRRQKWYAAVNSAQLELRRAQEQALEEFAKKVSAARESHVNALGDFIMRNRPGEGQAEMRNPLGDMPRDHSQHVIGMSSMKNNPGMIRDACAPPHNSLRLASVDSAGLSMANSMAPGNVVFDHSTPRGNVTFSIPTGVPSSASPVAQMTPSYRTPPAASVAMALQQTPNTVELSSGHRVVNVRSEVAAGARLGGRGASTMSVEPTDLNPTFSVEHAGSAGAHGRRPSPHPNTSQAHAVSQALHYGGPQHNYSGVAQNATVSPSAGAPFSENLQSASGNAALLPNNSPAYPMTQSAGRVAKANPPGVQAAQVQDEISQDERAAELANGMLKAAANGSAPLHSVHANGATSIPGSKGSKKTGATVQRKSDAVPLVKLADNEAVRCWLGKSYEDLKLNCYRSQAILKMCNRVGGVQFSVLHELLPFGRKTLTGRLHLLTSKGYLDETHVTEERRGKEKTIDVYTTSNTVECLQ